MGVRVKAELCRVVSYSDKICEICFFNILFLLNIIYIYIKDRKKSEI